MSIVNSFQSPDTNAKSMFRWWFPDASAKPEKIRAQMMEMYEGGFAGVEVALSPQFTDFDPNELGWGTPAWKEVLRAILRTAVELDGKFKVDFHLGAHWPCALNTICPNDDLQVQELVGAFEKLPKTPQGMCRIPMPEIKTNDKDAGDAADYIFVNKFVGLTAAQVASVDGDHFVLVWDSMVDLSSHVVQETDPTTGQAVWTAAGIPLHETKFGNWPKLRDQQYYYVADRSVFPASDNDNESIAPGDWLLFGFWRRGSGQTVSGRAFEVFDLSLPMGPKTYTVNFWDPAGMDQMTRYWDTHILDDPEILQLIKQVGATTDSCFKGGGIGGETEGRWTASMPADFKAHRGYDLMPYLPLLAYHDFRIQFYPYQYKYIMTADNGNDRRLLEDFFKTCIWLHMERSDKPMLKWANRLGYGVRAKNYAPLKEGSWFSMLHDQAEGATLDLRMKMDNFRDIASGSHVAGKKILAAEANADELMPYRLTFKNVCEKLNVCYAAGLNLAIFHGASYDEEYSGKYSQWPGWHCFQFSFAGAWGRRHPWWPGVHYLSDYLARTQAVLQAGTAKVDLLVYEPVRNTNEVWNGAARTGDYNYLVSKGYSYDIGGEAVITSPACALTHGCLAYDGPSYKALILRSCEAATMPAVEHMAALAEAGFPVISVGRLPNRVYGLNGNNCVTDEMICAAVKRLTKAPGYRHAEDEQGLVSVLNELGILPDQPCDTVGVTIAQRRDETSRWFYLYNASEETAYIPVNPTADESAYVADAWSGDIYRVDSAELALLPGAARFLVYAKAGIITGELERYTVPGEKIDQLTDFELKIESWGPAGNENDPCASKHTILNMGKPELVHWDAMDGDAEELKTDGSGSMYHISGIGEYKTSYAFAEEQDVYLVTKSAEDQIVGIYVNGVEQPRPDAVARYSKLHLTKGPNEILIRLASTLRRRVNLENPFFTEHDFEIMFGCIENYGAAKAPDPAKMNHYGLISAELYTMR